MVPVNPEADDTGYRTAKEQCKRFTRVSQSLRMQAVFRMSRNLIMAVHTHTAVAFIDMSCILWLNVSMAVMGVDEGGDGGGGGGGAWQCTLDVASGKGSSSHLLSEVSLSRGSSASLFQAASLLLLFAQLSCLQPLDRCQLSSLHLHT